MPLLPRRRPSHRLAAALAVAGALLLCACWGGGDGAAPPGSTGSSSGAGAAVSSARCAQNRAAGRITYLTGYQYQASTTILEAVAAQDLGYFKDLCLDVGLQPGTGDTAQNAQLTAAGRATVSDVGSEAEVLLAASGGVRVTSLATFGHVPIATLMTMPEVTDLKQLEGTTLGQKGSLPAPIRAMLVNAGVDVARIKQVKVGFDPSVLPRDQVQSLTGYKSNEPLALAAAGTKVKQWNPEDLGIQGSFGVVIANPAFVRGHPTAAQDFLRGVLHAHAHCAQDAAGCVQLAAKRSGSGFDVAHNVQVWTTEQALVAASTPAGSPVGYVDPAGTRAEGEQLLASGELTAVPDTTGLFDQGPLRAVYDGTTVVWPAP